MKKIKTWILSVPQEENSVWDIIWWWESRRIPYNGIVGAYGFLSLLLFFMFISLSNELKPGEDAVEPLALLFAPVMINVCYTSGWVFEVFSRLLIGKNYNRMSKNLFLAGTVFSLVVASIPSAWWATIWIYGIIHGKPPYKKTFSQLSFGSHGLCRRGAFWWRWDGKGRFIRRRKRRFHWRRGGLRKGKASLRRMNAGAIGLDGRWFPPPVAEAEVILVRPKRQAAQRCRLCVPPTG